MFWIDRPLKGVSKQDVSARELSQALCLNCRMPLDAEHFKKLSCVCPHCQHHHALEPLDRLSYLLDGEASLFGQHFKPIDVLNFKDNKPYSRRLDDGGHLPGADESLQVFRGEIDGMPLVVAVSDFRFIGGSMGRVMGDRLCHAIDVAIAENRPLMTICTSGGARMQEGVFALMQMARISMKLTDLAQCGLPHLTLLCNPTSGGVSASYAMQADVIMAEPGAMIGFAGPRVIKQTIQGELPKGFQTAESVYKAGVVDMIVPRSKQRSKIVSILNVLTKREDLK